MPTSNHTQYNDKIRKTVLTTKIQSYNPTQNRSLPISSSNHPIENAITIEQHKFITSTLITYRSDLNSHIRQIKGISSLL
jgi:hypothetical protein